MLDGLLESRDGSTEFWMFMVVVNYFLKELPANRNYKTTVVCNVRLCRLGVVTCDLLRSKVVVYRFFESLELECQYLYSPLNEDRIYV